MRRFLVLPIAVAALVLVGCAPVGPVQSPSSIPTPGTGEVGAHSPTSPTSAPDPVLPAIEITRTGGFAGAHQTLTIDSSGAFSGPTGSGRLSEAGRARLAQIVTDPALPGQVAAAPPGQCCDMFDYQLRVGGRTYAFGEPELGPLLAELLRLLHEETGF